MFSSAQTAVSPEADIAQPQLSTRLTVRVFPSKTESVGNLPQKLGSSAVARPVCESVDPIKPNR